MQQIIIVPARIGSTRLPRKPLLTIKGKPTIQLVYEAALETGLKVLVATDSTEILDTVLNFNGEAILTDSNLRSGTDRIAQALLKYDPHEQYTEVVNLQGDMPFVTPEHILDVLKPLQFFNMGTVVYDMDEKEYSNPNSVKAVVSFQENNFGRCHWFLRGAINYGYHHAGIYSFKRNTLLQISNLKTSVHEQTESLEQLRAIENNIIIGCYKTKPVPFEINTKEDLDKANKN